METCIDSKGDIHLVDKFGLYCGQTNLGAGEKATGVCPICRKEQERILGINERLFYSLLRQEPTKEAKAYAFALNGRCADGKNLERAIQLLLNIRRNFGLESY